MINRELQVHPSIQLGAISLLSDTKKENTATLWQPIFWKIYTQKTSSSVECEIALLSRQRFECFKIASIGAEIYIFLYEKWTKNFSDNGKNTVGLDLLLFRCQIARKNGHNRVNFPDS